jgi:glycosyltransferase involved in cell wall biosynthesis
MKVVYTNYPDSYAEVRNFIIPNRGIIEYRRSRDLFSILLGLLYKLTGKGYWPFLKGLYFNPFALGKEFHFFNTILIGSSNYEVTFETMLPRLGNAPSCLYRFAVRKLAKNNCKKIWALSQCAYDMQVVYIKQNFPTFANSIISKMAVKHPYQPPLIDKYEDKLLPTNKLVFTFTGADFFRKGGLEVLHAFDRLIPQYPQLQLNIISSLLYGDYATHTTKEHQEEALTIIKKYPQNIYHYWSLPNAEVLELYKRSHVGLLPTWADSYGYSVLEAQAAGCPVITTDIRALPEVNNDEIGWVVKVPKDDSKNARIKTTSERQQLGSIIAKELQIIIHNILLKPSTIATKGKLSLNKHTNG